jgi:hypothetical protein
LCYGCHSWWHSHPILAREWFAEKFPARFAYLTEPLGDNGKPRYQIIRPIREPELLEKEKFLKEKIKDLENENSTINP